MTSNRTVAVYGAYGHTGQENQFETDYGRAAEYLDASPPCLNSTLARSNKERNRYAMLIEWDSATGHLQGFR